MSKTKYIGKETPRILGRDILTGRAMYTADFTLPRMQYGRILRSPYSHAKILNIDASKALAMPGVSAVVTHEDVSRDIFVTNGWTPPKHHHIMDEKVRYIGDAVALIVAESDDLARQAMDLIEVEYEELPAVFTIKEAIKPDAPALYDVFPDNIAPHALNLNFEVGDIEKGFAEADAVIEIKTSMESGQNPLPVEPPTIIADWKDNGIDFIAACAAPAYCQQNVAASLNMPYEQIRIKAPAVGGSFGSKLYSGNVHCLLFAALMSKAAKVPVLFTYSKEEHFTSHQVRMSVDADIKFGMKKDGLATAIEMRQYSDAGCVASTQEFMTMVGCATMPILLKTNNKKFDGNVVLTNKVPSGSFRGYGYLESTALITRAIFKACEQLGVDPVDYFEKNALRHHEEFHMAAAPNGEYWQEHAGPDWNELVIAGAEAFKWKERWKGWRQPTFVDGHIRRGIGVCACGQTDTGGKQSNATITITGEGAIYVGTMMAEFGAGARDVMHKIAAEVLNVPLERIRVSDSDTRNTVPDFGSTGSRSTYTAGEAVRRAAVDALDKLFAMVHQKWGWDVDDCVFEDGKLYRKSNPDDVRALAPALMGRVDCVCGTGRFSGVENATIYHLQFVEVEVDTKLGTWKIIDHFGASDAGRIINPLPTKNQLQSFFAGIDLASFEETIWDPNNYRVLNPSNIDYKTRTFNDAVKHDHICLESFVDRESDFPFGAFGVGEPLLSPGGPAIRMAIYNACGIELDSYPFLPSKVLAALKELEGEN